jgi:hypothetical protein
MRYYFLNQDMKEFSFDVELQSGKIFNFQHEGELTSLHIKSLAGKQKKV